MENPAMQAEALKGMGRGPDTQLMHVTDSEVDALNGLSGLVFNEPLRTNPETGLPEAGLFKQLLPTILAIGAGAFLGPGAASMFAGMGAGTAAGGVGALATGLGTGLAAFGGHALGRAATGQDFSLLSSGLAGLGSGLTAGLTFDPGAAAVGTGTIDPTMATNAGAINPNLDVPASLGDYAIPGPPADAIYGGFSTAGEGGVQSLQSFSDAGNRFLGTPVGSTEVATGFGGMRTGPEAYDYLAAEPMKRVVMPLGMAALSGDFDQPLPEAPSGPSRTPFTPKDFKFTRERRDIDLDEDGEVSQEDIAQLVQGLPEGQSSRFYTPGVFTENEELNAKEGGLLRLQTGGNIQEAIGSLTGGAGASLLPMIAQSVIKPEDEEEESVSKGYPVGVAGTPPGAATTGMAIGGGQPPQPFQTGKSVTASGLTALEESFSPVTGAIASRDTGTNAPSTSANVTSAANVAGVLGGLPGLGLAVNAIGQAVDYANIPPAQRGSIRFNPTSLLPFNLGKETIAQQHANLTTQHELNVAPAPAPVQGPPTAEEAEEAAEAEAAEAAASMAALGMDLGDETEDDDPESVAEAMGSFAGVGSGPGGAGVGSGVGSDAASDGPGGTGGSDDYGEDDSGGGDSDGSDGSSGDGGEGGGPAGDKTGGLLKLIDTPLGDPYQQGGYLGGVSSRAHGGLLQLAGGGSVPYFEGRVMPTGNMTEDGMSDNIPFVIAGRQEGGQMGMQPAVLSPDEYVIPADVVSSLGNGSSNAGANDLDQFINNFRMDKYGRPNQPPEMRGGLSSLA